MSLQNTQNQDLYAPETEIYINDELIDKSLVFVSKLEVDLSSNSSSLFSLTLSKAINDTFEMVEPWVFKMGLPIKIRLGYQNNLEDVFEGIITSVGYFYGKEGHLDIELEGFDVLFLLMKSYQQRSFEKMQDSEVVNEVLQDYGFETIIDTTQAVYEHTQQNNESDFNFLSRLAKRNNFELHTQNREVYFQALSVDKSPIATFSFGIHPIELRLRHDLYEQVEEIKATAWDMLNNEALVETVSLEELKSVEPTWEHASKSLQRLNRGVINSPLSLSSDNSEALKSLALAKLENIAYNFVQSRAYIKGYPSLFPSNVIELKGFAQAHNGRYYLSRIIHRINEQEGFSTELELRGDRIHESL